MVVEKLEEKVLRSVFRRYTAEIEGVEEELNEYYTLSILAIALKDGEAYRGFQDMINEKYWPLFFRKIMLSTSLFFILLPPYMLVSHFLLKNTVPNAFSIIIFIAFTFFTIRLGYEIIKENVNSWRNTKNKRE